MIIVRIAKITLSSVVLFLLISELLQISYARTDSRVQKNSIGRMSVKPIKSISSGEKAKPGLPIRLHIPKIHVSAMVESVGLASNGDMDITKNMENVAWFELGQRPGEKGSAVIAGHYGWTKGKALVFNNLHKLRKGDTLYIEDEKGGIVHFVVREIQEYDPEADASEMFGSSDGKSHLTLITCQGWNKTTQRYSKRLVVFTDQE